MTTLTLIFVIDQTCKTDNSSLLQRSVRKKSILPRTMGRHIRSKSLKCRLNCKTECDTEFSNSDIYGRRQSIGSVANRKGSFTQKPIGQTVSLKLVYEDQKQEENVDVACRERSVGSKIGSRSVPGYPRLQDSNFCFVGTEDARGKTDCDTCACKRCMCDSCQCMEIVTPFAQVLSKLNSVRSNLQNVLNVMSEQGITFTNSLLKADVSDSQTNIGIRQPYLKQSKVSLADLDWCLDQLETLCSHQSVADMTREKFINLLAKEINKLPKSKSGKEISEHILSTYTQTTTSDPTRFRNVMRKNASTSRLACDAPNTISSNNRSINKDSKSLTVNWKLCLPETILDKKIPLPKHGVFTENDKELEKQLHRINSWSLDIFKLFEFSNAHPLTAVAFKIFQQHNILSKFEIDPTTLINYFMSIEKNYLSNAYHNSKHAADVMHTSHVLLSMPKLRNLFSSYEVTAALFAAAIHDVGHPGVSNQYLINTNSDLALLYNDNSILENHHVSIAFKLLQRPELDIFQNLSNEERKLMRKNIIDIVLATDMSKHLTILANMQTMMETRNLTGSGKEEERIKVLETMVHCADLSNPTKPIDIYQVWVKSIFEEFFCQGDFEREAGLTVSPNCDRNSVSIAENQVAFIDYIVRPLWETWSILVYPDAQDILHQLEENYGYYYAQLKN